MSRIYADADRFEAVFTDLFERIESDASSGIDELVDQRMVICFRVDAPDVELWVDGRSKPVVVTFGPGDLDASLTVESSGDSLHQLLLGTLSIAKAMLFRKVKVSGSKSKAMRLEGLLHAMQAEYPAVAAESGHG